MMPKGGYNFKHRSITDYSNPAWVTDNIVVYYNRAEHWFCFFLQVMLLNQTRPHRAMKVKRWPLMEKKECNTQCKFSSKILVHWFMRGQIRVTAKLSILLHFFENEYKLSKGCTKGFKTLRRQHFITLYHQLVLQSEIWIQGPLFAKSAKQMLYYGSHFHSRPPPTFYHPDFYWCLTF